MKTSKYYSTGDMILNTENGSVYCTVELSDSVLNGQAFEAVRTGSWDDAWKGKFEITEAMLTNFVKNFKANVLRKKDENGNPVILINYEHYMTSGGSKAAGWAKDLWIVDKRLDDGRVVKALMVQPKWTPPAAEAIGNGEWKYCSIEFRNIYKKAEVGSEELKDVLTGMALTNINFVDDLAPIQLSESKNVLNISKKEEHSMNKILGFLAGIGHALSEATEDAILSVVKEMHEEKQNAETKLSAVEKQLADVTASKVETEKQLGELTAKLSELEKATKDAEEKAKIEAGKLAEKRFSELMDDAVKSEKYLAADVKEGGVFYKLAKLDMALAEETLKSAPKKLSVPVGDGGHGNGTELSEDEMVRDEMHRLAKETGKSLAEVVETARTNVKNKNKGGK